MNRTIENENIKNILVIRRNNAGDMICAIPVFRTLRKQFPDASITVLADSSNAHVVRGASFIDNLLVYEKGEGIYSNKYINYWRLFRENGTKFDLVIVLKVGFSSVSALITLLSGARLRSGCLRGKWHPLWACYNLPVKVHDVMRDMHAVDGYLEALRTIGIKEQVRDISIETSPESRDRVRKFFEENNIRAAENVIVYNISNNRPDNMWPPERFKETMRLLSENYSAIHIISAVPSDREKGVALSSEMENAFYFPENSKFMDFAALVEQSDLLICGEGGSMHIGASVHTPVISLWGGTSSVGNWMHRTEKQFMVKKGKHVTTISPSDIIDVVIENNLLKGANE
ncbi:MAG TPA: lipopolysaccharide heptosyltransferase family protein [Nitrospirae bacterium]|nr:lipopolysaccharide heptosyltransferase family protein [Nitrospirota bacterium]